MWSSNDPVAFQQWKNYNFGNYFVTYQIFQIYVKYPSWRGRYALNRRFWDQAENQMTRYKSKATNELYPLALKKKLCVALFLSNLATAEWIPVKCKDQISPNVLCPIWNPRLNLSSLMNSEKFGCYGFQTIKNNTCFSFVHTKLRQNIRGQWQKQKINFTKSIWNSSHIKTVHLKNVKDLHYLFEAVSVTFPPLIVSCFVVEFTFALYVQQWFLSEVSYATVLDTREAELVGFNVLQSEYSHQPFGNNVFISRSTNYISSKYMCDNHQDCSDGSDENECTCSVPNEMSICRSLDNNEGQEICSSLYYKTRLELVVHIPHCMCKKNNCQFQFQQVTTKLMPLLPAQSIKWLSMLFSWIILFLTVFQQQMNLSWKIFWDMEQIHTAHNCIIFLVYRGTTDVMMLHTSAHLNSMFMVPSSHVELVHIWKVVRSLNATWNSNAKVSIVFHGHMCVMESGIVHLVLMKISIRTVNYTEIAHIFTDVGQILYVYMLVTCVIRRQTAPLEMMRTCVRHTKQSALFSVSVWHLQWLVTKPHWPYISCHTNLHTCQYHFPPVSFPPLMHSSAR